MSRVKVVAATVFVVFVVSAAGSSAVSAATAGWLVNGTLLTGTQTQAGATTAFVDEKGVMEFSGITITCNASALTAIGSQLESPNQTSATSIIFKGCTASGEDCTLSAAMSETIGTLPVTSEVTLDGLLALRGVGKPKTGTTLATLKLEGSLCAETAKLPVKGRAAWLAPTGAQDRTIHLLSLNITKAQEELEVGNAPASFKIRALDKLANALPWSFM